MQDGALQMVAAYFYVCAWEDSLARAIHEDDAVSATIAREHLGAVADLPRVGDLVQNLPEWEQAIESRLYDAEALASDVSTCTFYLEARKNS